MKFLKRLHSFNIKEGGYGKFMKMNDRQSSASWSKLNQVNKDDFY